MGLGMGTMDGGGMGIWMGSWRYMNGVADMGWGRFGGYGCVVWGGIGHIYGNGG